MKKQLIPLALAMLALTSGPVRLAHAAEAQRQAEVRSRGAMVMPFSLDATTHVFTKTPDGGIQQVVAKNPNDSEQIRLIRMHLRMLQDRFGHGDFSDPASIHGQQMPGLAALEAARPGEIRIDYRELPRGAELDYSSRKPELVAAIGAWFDAQLSDHGHDAMAGHMHMH